ncbi:isoleucine--tRNA ligase [Buchnera aphidicola (Nipponaphis monzeni)]|uniref:Isoleucine--tRNA ligase n=1 Tax=Buchnera aphidicola (Nipponaphis monzeni) TaxID=2495405 RepID=A0A455T9Y9_9GAMM|nr:isoleucine--tRNA ligase [Buchnera aphidicola]BBI01133.1 isoleucine--tRNA ligase [Buchnera aphidicola (Nipponaphis monzeni)]
MIDYRKTLNLPYTKFLMRGNLSENELITLKKWNTDNLYELIRIKKSKNKNFILHDGPPYANGQIHLGHALNKILKDIIIKSKNLSGYDAPYTPTWDCHGLPIEHKVEKIVSKYNNKMSNKKFREKCRNYAYKQVLKQKKDFVRLGILANWNHSYLTMDFSSESDIILKLSKIIQKKYVYREFKPVRWCIECHSSLAEAELEYFQINSDSIFVKFKFVNVSKILSKFNLHFYVKDIYMLIWTTTPWSLPANRAISINKDFQYQLIATNDYLFIVAKKLVNKVMLELAINKWKILGEILGKELELLKVFHPILNITVPIIFSEYVNLDSGTGIVHTAPDHGEEDFVVCKNYNIQPVNIIDGFGKHLCQEIPLIQGKNIFESNKIIIKILNNNNTLMKIKKIIHKYPHCWRHKKPIFFRATPQWFISMENNNLKKDAIIELKNIQWKPYWGKERLQSMLVNRPDWCISRQRIWGVPIPVFVHKSTGQIHPNTCYFMKQIANAVSKIGIEFWWDLNINTMLGKDAQYYVKNLDILDVWFESGSVDAHSIYKNTKFDQKQSDLYLEGSDQYRGWFMSSLLISMATNYIAPYQKILTHGFTVDKSGFKMSKSRGNIINPNDIINKFGADVLRLWVASTDYFKEIAISSIILDRVVETYRKIRNTARFILSNLSDFNPDIDIIPNDNMIMLDKWIVGKSKLLQNEIIHLYDTYNFHGVIHSLVQFCSIEMGSFYLDIIKDRLYTTKRNSLARRSCQTALYLIINAFVRWIAPILSFTADEIWNFIPGQHSKYVFLEEWYDQLFDFSKEELLHYNDWNNLIQIKNEVNKVLEIFRKNKLIKNSLNASLTLYLNTSLATKLKNLQTELKFIFITSEVIIQDYKKAPTNAYKSKISFCLKIVIKSINKEKCARCWHSIMNDNKSVNNTHKICDRCISNVLGIGEKRLFL